MNEHDFALLRFKASTGQMINPNGSFYDGEEEFCEIVDGIEFAKSRAQQIVDEDGNVEVSIFDRNGCFVAFFRGESG